MAILLTLIALCITFVNAIPNIPSSFAFQARVTVSRNNIKTSHNVAYFVSASTKQQLTQYVDPDTNELTWDYCSNSANLARFLPAKNACTQHCQDRKCCGETKLSYVKTLQTHALSAKRANSSSTHGSCSCGCEVASVMSFHLLPGAVKVAGPCQVFEEHHDKTRAAAGTQWRFQRGKKVFIWCFDDNIPLSLYHSDTIGTLYEFIDVISWDPATPSATTFSPPAVCTCL